MRKQTTCLPVFQSVFVLVNLSICMWCLSCGMYIQWFLSISRQAYFCVLSHSSEQPLSVAVAFKWVHLLWNHYKPLFVPIIILVILVNRRFLQLMSTGFFLPDSVCIDDPCEVSRGWQIGGHFFSPGVFGVTGWWSKDPSKFELRADGRGHVELPDPDEIAHLWCIQRDTGSGTWAQFR